MKNNHILQQPIVLRLSFFVLTCWIGLIPLFAQNQSKESQSNMQRLTATCEDWLTLLGLSVQEWNKNKEASLIIIAHPGRGESRRVNLKRIKTLKEYILNPEYKIKAIFAEGEMTEDMGIIEFYVNGKFFESAAIRKKEDIPLKLCN